MTKVGTGASVLTPSGTPLDSYQVQALIMTGSTGARPIGAALGGAIGVACGLEWSIVVSALGFLVQALIILTSPLAGLGAVPDGRMAAPAAAKS